MFGQKYHSCTIKGNQIISSFICKDRKLKLKDGLLLKIKKMHIHLFYSHTVLVKLCPCGRYRQLIVVLYHNKHNILKSSNIIFNRLVLKDF